MTREEQKLLLKVLCAGLPYGVRVKLNGRREKSNKLTIDWLYAYSRHIEDIKPYLRPMSSMTEEEFTYIKQRWVFTEKCRDENDIMDVVNRGCVEICDAYSFVDWLNSHHFDYRGLIEKGLALAAPEGMYKI